tara:strand:- start:1846 stop:3030 length:1185 start_codon:yes stop_codon:yes gene_type:complete
MLQLQSLRQTNVILAFLLCSLSFDTFANIGNVSELNGTPGSIERQSGENLTAELSTKIESFDQVETTNGRLKIQFVDDTKVSLTEHTYMEINEYVYDPDPSKSKMALNFVQGTARFATGGLGLVPKENIQIQTPTATIGIRGTDFTTTVDELGRSLVILLPDEDCTDKVALEEGCKPSGSITITNEGGTVVLDEAYMSAMVSTYETPPTNPVVLSGIDLNVIDNMFIVSEPEEIREAIEEQLEEKQGADYLAFTDLDVDLLEENILEEDVEADLEFTELDINFLDVDLLQDLLEIIEVAVDLDDETAAQDSAGSSVADIRGTISPGFDPQTSFNTIIDQGRGQIWFYRDNNGIISVRIPIASQATIDTEVDGKTGTIVVNGGGSISIIIRQQSG